MERTTNNCRHEYCTLMENKQKEGEQDMLESQMVAVELMEEVATDTHKIYSSPTAGEAKLYYHSNTQHTLMRTASLIVLLVCCVFGTPLTLVFTVPAYLLADQGDLMRDRGERSRMTLYAILCNILTLVALVMGGAALTGMIIFTVWIQDRSIFIN